MKTFALDLLHDLREKRLWPVAAALLLGLIAVPVVLSKSAPPAPEPVVQATPQPAAAELPQLKNLTVVADTAAARGGSTLDAFKAKDPFRPPAIVLNEDKDAPSVATAPKAAAAGGRGGGKTGSGGSGGSTGPSPAPVTPRAPAPSPPARPRSYAFVADLDFGRSGQERRFNPLDKLGMLPSQELPLLIFLGVDPEGDNAVFLVDSTLTTAGEGRCNPSPTECATLTIGAGSEHEFADQDGQSYTLRINEIRRQRLTSVLASASRRGRARASTGPRRRFVPPILADLVTVASPTGHTSSTGTGRR